MARDDERGQYPYRDQRAVMAALEHQARLRGRTISAELRLAVRAWLRQAMLAQLHDPQGRAEAAAEGHDVDADEALIRAQLDELYERAFEVPNMPDLREVVVGNGRLH